MFFNNKCLGCEKLLVWKIYLFLYFSSIGADDVNEGGDLSIPKRKYFSYQINAVLM